MIKGSVKWFDTESKPVITLLQHSVDGVTEAQVKRAVDIFAHAVLDARRSEGVVTLFDSENKKFITINRSDTESAFRRRFNNSRLRVGNLRRMHFKKGGVSQIESRSPLVTRSKLRKLIGDKTKTQSRNHPV